MAMVWIGGMRVRVARPFVRVRVRVLARRIDVVRMGVMAVVVPMCVLVLLRFVRVHVIVGLRHVQPNADSAQGARNDRRNPAEALTNRPGGNCAEKGGSGKDGTGSSCPNEALRTQVQAQAQPVADAPAGDQACRCIPVRQGLVDGKSQPRRERGAERSLCQNDLRSVAIGERSADDVVGCPGDRRTNDGKGSPAAGHPDRPPTSDQHCAPGDERHHCKSHTPSDGLVPDDAREQNREDRLET